MNHQRHSPNKYHWRWFFKTHNARIFHLLVNDINKIQWCLVGLCILIIFNNAGSYLFWFCFSWNLLYKERIDIHCIQGASFYIYLWYTNEAENLPYFEYQNIKLNQTPIDLVLWTTNIQFVHLFVDGINTMCRVEHIINTSE